MPLTAKDTDEEEEQISLFRLRVTNKRFDEETLRVLQSELVYKDLEPLLKARSRLSAFLRPRSLSAIRELADKSVERKLSVLEFFVRAFAVLGDAESCLAIKYEGLLLREFESVRCQWLRVSELEWINFAQDLLDNGFFSIARQACENALLCLPRQDAEDAKTDEFKRAQIVAKINRLKEHALKAAASGSVQAHVVDRLKKKAVEKSITHFLPCKEPCVASTLFRNGIKKRNASKLRQSQNLKQKTSNFVGIMSDEVN